MTRNKHSKSIKGLALRHANFQPYEPPRPQMRSNSPWVPFLHWQLDTPRESRRLPTLTMDGTGHDPLSSLRLAIADNSPPIPTTSQDQAKSDGATDNLARAQYLHFTEPNDHSFPLTTPTRFILAEKAVDLRSLYFAWQKKDVGIPEYIASTQQLNEELAATDGAGAKVQNLVFAERLDLITWLEGASDDSDFIKPLASDSSAAKSAQLASGATGGVSTVPSGAAGGRGGKQVDPRLQEIYNLERRMGDRNSILRGIKPTVRHFACFFR